MRGEEKVRKKCSRCSHEREKMKEMTRGKKGRNMEKEKEENVS